MFDLFETFITLYDTRSFTVTANILFITQSTVTKRIQRLENELESQFFTVKILKKFYLHKKLMSFILLLKSLFPNGIQFKKT